MGLDCTAYERVKLVEECRRSAISEDRYDEMYDSGQLHLSNMPEFTERGDGLPEGIEVREMLEALQECRGFFDQWHEAFRLAAGSGIVDFH